MSLFSGMTGKKFFYFCKHCDPNAEHHVEGHKKCPTCKNLIYYSCPESKLSGRYTNYDRHARQCNHCKLRDPEQQKAKMQKRMGAKDKLAAAQASQEPLASWWSRDWVKMHEETGVCEATWDLALRSTRDELSHLHGQMKQRKGRVLLTPESQLLLLLHFMRKNPTASELAFTFPGESRKHILEHVECIARALAPIMNQYIGAPPHVRRIILSGELEGAACITDTTDFRIPRPGHGQSHDRKLYFDGKYRLWGLKAQITTGLDGRVWECSQVVACSKSDRALFEASELPALLSGFRVEGIGDSHYVKCEHMYGTKKGKHQAVDFAQYNQSIENVRALIENLNHRLKICEVFGGIWQHDRHNLDFLSNLLAIACALLNMEIDNGHPIRANLSTLQPRIANPRHERKRKAKELAAEEEELEGSEEESEEEKEEEVEEEEKKEEEFHEIECILSHRNGKARGKAVIFYRVKFLGGGVLEVIEQFITEEALAEYKAKCHKPKGK
jgi:hypothetical protein